MSTSKAAGSKHPTSSEMIIEAIWTLKEKNGTALPGIKKYLASNFQVDLVKIAPFIRRSLKSLVEQEKLIQSRGTGANGRFKLSVDLKASMLKAEKSKKAATSSKKPVPKKTASPKTKKSKKLMPKAMKSNKTTSPKKSAPKAKKPVTKAAPPKTKAVPPKSKKTVAMATPPKKAKAKKTVTKDATKKKAVPKVKK